MMNTELDRLEAEVRDLDTFAKTERDILDHMERVGMSVAPRERARIGRIQEMANGAWTEYRAAVARFWA